MSRAGLLVLRDVDYAALLPITADTTSSYTTGDGYEVPGIRKLEVKPEIDQDELYGSAKVLDVYAKAKKATFSLEHAVLSMDILEKITGGTSISSGTTPNEIREFIWSADDALPYFSIIAKCNYQGGTLTGGSGDQLFQLWKCKITSFTIGLQMDGYALCSMEGIAISPTYTDPTSSKRKLFSIFERESAASISLTADTTAPTLTSVTLTSVGGSALANNATGVSTAAVFFFNYSEAMHKSWIQSQFTLTETATGADVPVTVALVGTDSVSVTPDSALAGNTNYILCDTTQVRDLAGNRKAARSIRHFTTA